MPAKETKVGPQALQQPLESPRTRHRINKVQISNAFFELFLTFSLIGKEILSGPEMIEHMNFLNFDQHPLW
jgi:hypothetical protein